MKKTMLLLSVICVLIISCSSNAEAGSTPETSQQESYSTISSGVLKSVTQNQMAPMTEIYPLILGFKLANNRFPQAPQELIDFNNTSTNEPCINLDDYKTLTFTLEDDKSLTVAWETKSEPISKGSFTMDPSDNSANSSVEISGIVNTAQPVN